jgi:alpha-mannosidase
LFLLQTLVDKYGEALLPRDALEGIDQLFFRDAIGNIDMDCDGVDDSFRLTVTNPWYDQRITGVEIAIDGRPIPVDKLVLRYPSGETRASDVVALEFPPGDAMEIIAEGTPLADGLHLIDFLLDMELVPQIIPLVPILMKDGIGDFPILPDCFEALPAWPPGALEPGTVHVVPHIHYDVEWMQTRDVFERLGAGNLKEALRLMDEDAEMTFVVDQVPYMEPFRRSDPEDFGRIVERVREGRIEPVNGMYSEPDVNLISGEALVRQSVAWQRYSLEKFGMLSRCGWLIDSFGMTAQLPQIFAKSGTELFAYSRAKSPEDLPSEFLWEGLDGTRLVTTCMPKKYNVGHPVPTDRSRALRWMLKNYRFLRERSASDQVFYPGGVDHGRPQKEYGDMARAWNSEVEGVTFKFSTPSAFFEALPREKLPVIKGEFQRELWGTYGSRIELKKLNRSCEFALLDAGKLATIASLAGAAYPLERLEEAWRTVMDCHFHDQICGCSIDEVAVGMERRFNEALGVTADLMSDAARSLAGVTGSAGFTLFVFNPLSQPVSSWVEFDVELPLGWRELAVSAGGERLPVQVVDATLYGDGSLKAVKAGFRPDLPALGYRLFELAPSNDGQPDVTDPVKTRDTTIDNGLLRVEVDGSTGLLEQAVLADGTAFDLEGGNRLTLERDFGNLYEAMALGTTFLKKRTVESVRAIESGPLRGTIEVKGTVGRSSFTQTISLVSGSPRIDIETQIEFKDAKHRLRCVFPTGIEGGTWTHEIPYGCMERPGHELAAQNFTDLSGGGRGVTLINFGTPGNEQYKGTIYLTLMRSTDKAYLWDTGPLGLELGHHVFRYALYPHRGDWSEAGSVAEAYRRNDGPRAVVFEGAGKGQPSHSALSCRPGSVMVSVLEMNDSRDIVLRLWETSGRETTAELDFDWDVEKAVKTDLLERELKTLTLEGRRLALPLSPFEIATVALVLGTDVAL